MSATLAPRSEIAPTGFGTIAARDGEAVRRYREHADSMLEGLRTERYQWWAHWRQCADFILPHRYRWLVTPNEWKRGGPLNQKIIDNTGTKAASICSAGMMSGITSPGKPWFKLTIPDMDAIDASPVKMWLDEVEKRMQRVLAASNYYEAKAQQYADLVVFGTAPMLILEDRDDVIRCYGACAGEYFLGLSPRLTIDTLVREITMTVRQAVTEFGLDAVTDATRNSWKQAGAALTREVKVVHAIDRNDGRIGGQLVPKRFQWREGYWEAGSRQDEALRVRGYMEQPFSCPRWSLSGNDAYGRSPAMEALGAIKQLQLEQRRKGQAIDKMVNPPVNADASLKNTEVSLIPGGVNYVNGLTSGNKGGITSVYEVQPRLAEMIEDIREVQQRIQRTFFVDLFQMMSESEKEMTAFEVARRQEEKLIVLGPVIERNENEGLDPDLDRVFAIMQRRGMLPPAPKEIHGYPLQIQYVSMLAVAQKAASTSALEQLVHFAGAVVSGDLATAQSGGAPTVWDNIDRDELLDEYADMLGVSAKVIRASVEVMKMRAAREQQQQAAQAMQMASAASESAKTLSQTDVGGGSNALAMMLGGGPEMQAAA